MTGKLLNPCVLRSWSCEGRAENDPEDVVKYLDGTEDGEAGEEPHGAADQAQLGLNGHLPVLLYLVIGRRVKVDLDNLQTGKLVFDADVP